MDRRRERRSPRGLIEETESLSIADLRHDLRYAGQDQHPITIVGGPYDGAIVTVAWSKLKHGWRPWLTCPACGKPRGTLYDIQLTCRGCAGLDYPGPRC